MEFYDNSIKAGPQHALSNYEIIEYCKNRFKELKFLGAPPSNDIPKQFFNSNKEQKIYCCIANNATIAEGGEHWVALIKKKNGKVIMYDSFARDSVDLSPFFSKQWKETDKKKEQKILDQNCGYRCIVFLDACEKYGIDETIKIL